ncbi:MAG: YbaB/EbfC family nucleoid-associated protein [Mycoplasmatales bacterium]
MNQNQLKQMMQQAQKMQKDMEKAQAEIESKTFKASAGGVVEVEMTGAKKLVGVNIKPEVLAADEKEMVEEMVMLAVNNVLSEIESETETKLGAFTQGLPF